RQALPESAKTHTPLSWFAKRIFEIHTEARGIHSALATIATAAALVPVSADKILVLGFYIAKTRHVNAIGAVAERHLIFMTWHGAGCPAAHMVVHQIVSKFAAAVRKTVWKFRCRRVQQDPRRFQRGRAEENDASMELESFFGLPIDYPYAADSPRGRIKNQTVHDAVRTDREFSRLHGRRKRGIQAAEIRRRDAATMAHAAIVASGAAL